MCAGGTVAFYDPQPVLYDGTQPCIVALAGAIHSDCVPCISQATFDNIKVAGKPLLK